MTAPDKIWIDPHGGMRSHVDTGTQQEKYTRTASIPDPMTDPRVVALVEALKDAMAGLEYVRHHYGELHGVGFMRVRDAGDAALAAMKGEAE